METFSTALFSITIRINFPNKNPKRSSPGLERRKAMRLAIEVIEIEGQCPVYRIGDKIILDDGYKVNLRETDNICMHSLSSILPYYNSLSKGVSPQELGLAKEGKDAYVQCLNPKKYTGGGTVTFIITREE